MRKVLMIAYIFPPLGGAGVHRTLKFAKYLPPNGWKPIVVSADDPEWQFIDVSGELERDIPSEVEVHREKPHRFLKEWSRRRFVGKPIRRLRGLAKRYAYLLAVPDPRANWLIPAFREASRIIREQRDIEIVYTTSAPYTDHLVGLILKLVHRKPWVVDLRDPWCENTVIFGESTPFVRKANSWLEAQVLKSADHVITVAEPFGEMLQAKIERLGGTAAVSVITNGFDSDDLAGIHPTRNSSFDISYVGELYGSLSAGGLIHGVASLAARVADQRDKIRLNIIGSRDYRNQAEIDRLIRELKITDVVEIKSYVPRSQALSAMVSSDLLVLILGEDWRATGGIYPGKLFTYLACKKPILAIVPPGATADLVKKLRAGTVVDPADFEGIASAISVYYEQFRHGKSDIELDGDIGRFERRVLTEKLAKILDQFSGTSGRRALM
jgi:glycosyltransferase involved in cell wall biosynthesis